MKLETVYIEDENGEVNPVAVKDYLKGAVEQYSVEAFKNDKVEVPPAKVVKAIFDSAVADKEPADELTENYSEAVEGITEVVKSSIKHIEAEKQKAADEKEAKKKEKEEEKAKKEKEAKELAERQGKALAAVTEGSQKADEQFVRELEALKDNLPEGVTIEQSGDGYGVVLGEGAGDEALGNALGYFIGAEKNSSFLATQIQFYIGDLAVQATARGLFKTALECSKSISKHLDTQGKRIAPGVVDTYRRMSERTPTELRNPKADPTAYLELSRMKRPKKGDKESKEAFEKRKSEFNKDIEDLQKKIASGDIETRKDVLAPAQEIKYKHGIEERPDPNKVVLSKAALLEIYFTGTILLENSIGVHKDEEGNLVEDSICFTDPEDPTTLVWLTEDELKTKVAEAKAELMNLVIAGKSHTVEEALKGAKKEEQDVVIGHDAEKDKAITEKRMVEVPVILPAFFPIASEDSDAESEG